MSGDRPCASYGAVVDEDTRDRGDSVVQDESSPLLGEPSPPPIPAASGLPSRPVHSLSPLLGTGMQRPAPTSGADIVTSCARDMEGDVTRGPSLQRTYSLEGMALYRRSTSGAAQMLLPPANARHGAPPRSSRAQDPPPPPGQRRVAKESKFMANAPPKQSPRQASSMALSHDQRSMSTSGRSLSMTSGSQDKEEDDNGGSTFDSSLASSKKGGFIYYIIYATVNSIMCIPCLYGYASVIFRHEAFQPEINALSKLVIFSSVVHQFAFTIFSTLPFAIGQVQDAGLIFLSAMSDKIADTILSRGGTQDDIVSTTVVLLGLCTACLGALLILMGKFRIADIVSYLPFPVVGGYLAFIGYFCIEAGVALCISESMVGLGGWAQLFNKEAILLALPGIVCGIALTIISRYTTNDIALPLAMVTIPATFYVLLFSCGWDLNDAREGGWVGKESPPVPFTAMLDLVDFSKVHWALVLDIIGTWAGMVFVVSFSSCLDVAAISMDMGEALDTNMELMTVGIANLASGLLCGQTGSYIFSQTIFTYRTQCWSRWIGLLVAFSFIAVVVSPINFLQVAPLFFLGSTLIFIGLDIGYEWLIEVRHKLLLTEYCILLGTFAAIHLVGINGGIVFGICVAVVDYVIATARVSSLTRVSKRSRAVWRPEEQHLLQLHGYHIQNPKIVTFEVKGSVFFGSALQLLTSITDEVGISTSAQDRIEINKASARHLGANASPVPPSFSERKRKRGDNESIRHQGISQLQKASGIRIPPSFVVLDLAQVPNLDASAARACFLQLAKMCSKRSIFLCASGANMRVDWMLRTHDAAYTHEEEERLMHAENGRDSKLSEKLLLFGTLYEALEYCESQLICQLETDTDASNVLARRLEDPQSPKTTVSYIFSHVLGLDQESSAVLSIFDETGSNSIVEEAHFHSGELIFQWDSPADAFYVVLSGSVAILLPEQDNSTAHHRFLSGQEKLSKAKRPTSRHQDLARVQGIRAMSAHTYTWEALSATLVFFSTGPLRSVRLQHATTP